MSTIAKRFNNPLNIRLTSDRWLGQEPPHKNDKFVRFKHPVYGFRAFFLLLITYRKRYDIWTIKDIISRFAPATENNTEVYIQTVCNYLGFPPETSIPFDDSDSLCSLAWCMCRVESGIWWNTDHIGLAYDWVFESQRPGFSISELI